MDEWQPIGTASDSRSPAPPPARDPSELFLRACGTAVLLLTVLWARYLLIPLLLLPLQPPPWPLDALRAPLAVGASLLFSYLFWLSLACFRAGGHRD
jgi:hypothetical protein